MDAVLKTIISDKPDFVVIDSIQTMALNLEDKIPGSITQVRACTQAIFRVCKEHNISAFIIGHITKEGTVAGPKLLEHIVDTVLYFEDDTKSNLRILRCKKNRFGSSDVIAVFEMVNSGLREVKNPSEIFIDTARDDTTGSTVTCIIEGNRPILIEVQALVTKSSFGIARRNISGGDLNRLNLLVAVIEKRMNLPLYQYDIYVNITGGFKVRDTGIDLAIIMAIISSYSEKKLGTKCMYCGEVGLSGEVRNVSGVSIRVREAAKLGFKKIFIPSTALTSIEDSIYKEYSDIEIKGVKDVLV
jgi:DNA repair protein RadA/Sms